MKNLWDKDILPLRRWLLSTLLWFLSQLWKDLWLGMAETHWCWSEPALVLKHTACVPAVLVVHFTRSISSLTDESH